MCELLIAVACHQIWRPVCEKFVPPWPSPAWRSRRCRPIKPSTSRSARNRENPRGALSGAADHELHPGPLVVESAAAVCFDRRNAMAREGDEGHSGLHERTDTGDRRAVSTHQPRGRVRVQRCRQRSPATARPACCSRKVAYFILPDSRKTTSSSTRAGPTTCSWPAPCCRAPANEPHDARSCGECSRRMPTKLQRPDGLFIHAENGPHAWGRGNGFALLGVTEALTHLPSREPCLSHGPRGRSARDLSPACRGARETSIRRWQLATGRRRARQLSRADRDGDDRRRRSRAAFRAAGSIARPTNRS